MVSRVTYPQCRYPDPSSLVCENVGNLGDLRSTGQKFIDGVKNLPVDALRAVFSGGGILSCFSPPDLASICDLDGDGEFAATPECGGSDCNDNNYTINSRVNEIMCNGVDENCNGMGDGDEDCDGYKIDEGDCNDKSEFVHPNAFERCNNDDNCDGVKTVPQSALGFDLGCIEPIYAECGGKTLQDVVDEVADKTSPAIILVCGGEKQGSTYISSPDRNAFPLLIIGASDRKPPIFKASVREGLSSRVFGIVDKTVILSHLVIEGGNGESAERLSGDGINFRSRNSNSLFLDHVMVGQNTGAGVRVSGADKVILSGVRVYNNGYAGVDVYGAHEFSMSDSEITGSPSSGLVLNIPDLSYPPASASITNSLIKENGVPAVQVYGKSAATHVLFSGVQIIGNDVSRNRVTIVGDCKSAGALSIGGVSATIGGNSLIWMNYDWSSISAISICDTPQTTIVTIEEPTLDDVTIHGSGVSAKSLCATGGQIETINCNNSRTDRQADAMLNIHYTFPNSEFRTTGPRVFGFNTPDTIVFGAETYHVTQHSCAFDCTTRTSTCVCE